jgi:hypothetical protein
MDANFLIAQLGAAGIWNLALWPFV